MNQSMAIDDLVSVAQAEAMGELDAPMMAIVLSSDQSYDLPAEADNALVTRVADLLETPPVDAITGVKLDEQGIDGAIIVIPGVVISRRLLRLGLAFGRFAADGGPGRIEHRNCVGLHMFPGCSQNKPPASLVGISLQ